MLFPDKVRRTTSAFTRVFDALWRRTANPGPFQIPNS
jgi:hypothetical protein